MIQAAIPLIGEVVEFLGMVEEGNHVAAKLRFHGLHRKPLFGVHPAGAIFGSTERPYSLSRDRR